MIWAAGEDDAVLMLALRACCSSSTLVALSWYAVLTRFRCAWRSIRSVLLALRSAAKISASFFQCLASSPLVLESWVSSVICSWHDLTSCVFRSSSRVWRSEVDSRRSALA